MARKCSHVFRNPFFVFLGGVVYNVAFPRRFTLSRGAEEGTGRNRCCYGAQAFSDLRGSSAVTVCGCVMQRGNEVETSRPPSYVVPVAPSEVSTHTYTHPSQMSPMRPVRIVCMRGYSYRRVRDTTALVVKIVC